MPPFEAQNPTLTFVGGEVNRASPCAFCMKVSANMVHYSSLPEIMLRWVKLNS